VEDVSSRGEVATMTDGLSDARREALRVIKVEQAIALLKDALEDGAFDPLFGIDARLLSGLNTVFKRYGYVVKST